MRRVEQQILPHIGARYSVARPCSNWKLATFSALASNAPAQSRCHGNSVKKCQVIVWSGCRGIHSASGRFGRYSCIATGIWRN
jgi:formylmethanofuran dehydrogenase subunit B